MRRRIIFQANAIIVPVAFGLSIYNAIWQPVTVVSHFHQALTNLLQSVIVVVLIDIGSDIVLGRWLQRHARWAVRDGEPDASDLDDLIRLPVRGSLTILIVVVASTLTITFVGIAFGTEPASALGIGFGLALAGFTFALIVYLQLERTLRPLFALALTGAPLPERRLVGVAPRLVVIWMLGSAGPLLFILAIPLRASKGHAYPLVVPMIFMAASGLVLGAIITLLGARSVAEPITQVRLGLQRVGAGDLDTEIDVTNPGDLGQLQAGFNTMVTGLRERRTLEDLFGRHVGEDVARQALGTQIELGGETRPVTVLFVDIIGSTGFAESHDPRTVVSRVNELFQVVFEVVSAEGGWINKFEGDGCLCVFGAPSDLPDHCGRGLRAARTLATRVEPLSVEVGIGVSSGEVVAGNVGSIERFEYTVMGRPVNEAARLTDAAKSQPGHVLAAWHSVESAASEADHWERTDALTLRGVQAPVAVARPRS
jgi:adenylate cyclase